MWDTNQARAYGGAPPHVAAAAVTHHGGSTLADSDARGTYHVETEPGFSTRRISRLRHNYDRHPMMRIDRLQALAHRLQPLGKCRFLERPVTGESDFKHVGQDPKGRSLDAAFRDLHLPGGWIALYDIHLVPEYARFVQEVMDSIDLRDCGNERPIVARGYLFISSSPSLTPFHFDRDDNFWLQIHGRKTISVWDHRDRVAVPASEVERFVHHGKLNAVHLRSGVRERAIDFDAGPGDGVYMPSTSPHMTQTHAPEAGADEDPSVSLAVVFNSRASKRLEHVHAFNTVLRRIGLDPQAEAHPLIDRVKAPLGRAVIALKRRVTGYRPPG
jgi:hypothetical protein